MDAFVNIFWLFPKDSLFQLGAGLVSDSLQILQTSSLQVIVNILYTSSLQVILVRDGHGGGWSRKINARYLHTLMVYL